MRSLLSILLILVCYGCIGTAQSSSFERSYSVESNEIEYAALIPLESKKSLYSLATKTLGRDYIGLQFDQVDLVSSNSTVAFRGELRSWNMEYEEYDIYQLESTGRCFFSREKYVLSPVDAEVDSSGLFNLVLPFKDQIILLGVLKSAEAEDYDQYACSIVRF